MLGTACFWLCSRNSSHFSSKFSLSQFYHYTGYHSYSSQVFRPHVGPSALTRSLSFPPSVESVSAGTCSSSSVKTVKRTCCHTSLCIEEGHEVNCATIWHGLLPSHHPSLLDQNSISSYNGTYFGTHCRQCFLPSNPLSFSCNKDQGLGRFAVPASLLDGSWNVAWDARPARWLHGSHSVWLLFGVCTCFATAMGFSITSVLPRPLAHIEEITDNVVPAENRLNTIDRGSKQSLTGKQVYTDYSVTGIPSDGRCLFRAIAHGASVLSGKPVPSESLQQELADDLRAKVVNELITRRSESEWFIEGDFEVYVKRMREPYVWGGEPEILMASHVLKMPITVLFFDRSLNGLISIAEYGSEYGNENPIRILYHGFGHYDAVQLPGTNKTE